MDVETSCARLSPCSTRKFFLSGSRVPEPREVLDRTGKVVSSCRALAERRSSSAVGFVGHKLDRDLGVERARRQRKPLRAFALVLKPEAQPSRRQGFGSRGRGTVAASPDHCRRTGRVAGELFSNREANPCRGFDFGRHGGDTSGTSAIISETRERWRSTPSGRGNVALP